MHHALTIAQVQQLQMALATLSGYATIELLGGKVRLLVRRLSGPAACALLPAQPDRIVRIVVDPAKPDFLGHVRCMIRETCGVDLGPLIDAPRVPMRLAQTA